MNRDALLQLDQHSGNGDLPAHDVLFSCRNCRDLGRNSRGAGTAKAATVATSDEVATISRLSAP